MNHILDYERRPVRKRAPPPLPSSSRLIRPREPFLDRIQRDGWIILILLIVLLLGLVLCNDTAPPQADPLRGMPDTRELLPPSAYSR